MFVAALCAKAELAPVFDEKPDIRYTVSGQTFGVAVERVKSPPERLAKAITERSRSAADQVKRSGLPGIIVIDVSQSLNPDNWRVPIEKSDVWLWADWTSRMRHLLKAQLKECQLNEWLLDRLPRKNVRGVTLIDHIVRCPPDGAWHMQVGAWPINLCPYNERRGREFDFFQGCIERAIASGGGDPMA